MYLGRDTRTSTQSRRLVRRVGGSEERRQLEPELAIWSNFLAQKQFMHFFWCLCDYFALVFLCYWESIN